MTSEWLDADNPLGQAIATMTRQGWTPPYIGPSHVPFLAESQWFLTVDLERRQVDQALLDGNTDEERLLLVGLGMNLRNELNGYLAELSQRIADLPPSPEMLEKLAKFFSWTLPYGQDLAKWCSEAMPIIEHLVATLGPTVAAESYELARERTQEILLRASSTA